LQSLGSGIVFATPIALVLIPSLYMVIEDVKRLFGGVILVPGNVGAE
jgi:hypothetical protein